MTNHVLLWEAKRRPLRISCWSTTGMLGIQKDDKRRLLRYDEWMSWSFWFCLLFQFGHGPFVDFWCHEERKIQNVTVEMAINGARAVKSMVTETRGERPCDDDLVRYPHEENCIYLSCVLYYILFCIYCRSIYILDICDIQPVSIEDTTWYNTAGGVLSA